MALSLCSKTLTFFNRLSVKTPTSSISVRSPPLVSHSIRHHSSKAQLIEIDLESDAAAMRKLEDIVRRIIVHKATPVWLPFIPGSSFWVPPPRGATKKIADLVDKLTNQLIEEEYLSVMSLRGWPCSSFFIPPEDDSASTERVDVELEFKVPGNEVVELKVELLSYPERSSKSEDEEN